MLASVIVPAFNAAETIGDCLAALTVQAIDNCYDVGQRGSFEIIVVDDGSTDDTAIRVSRSISTVGPTGPEIFLLRQPRGGAAAARNQSVAVARGEIVVFTDADCVPAPGWLSAMLAPLLNDPVLAGVRGVYITEQRGLVPRFVQQEYIERYARAARAVRMDFVDTYSAAYRRTIFLQAGGFDTHYRGATVEDQELSYRLAEQGCRFMLNQDAQVAHRHPATLWIYARRKYRIGRDKPRVHLRHPAHAISDAHTPQTVKIQIILLGPLLLSLVWVLMSWVLRHPAHKQRRPLLLLALSGGGFIFSALPLLRQIGRNDSAVLLVAPAMILIRATALGSGLIAGIVGLTLRRLDREHASSRD